MSLTSFGPANRIARSPETHPLTWRLRDDGEPVWLDEYQAKDGYAAARKAFADILSVAERLPERVVQEDPELLMYYDAASLRA